MSMLLLLPKCVLLIVFTLSVFGKLRNPHQFHKTVKSFRILPSLFTFPASIVFIAVELIIIILLLTDILLIAYLFSLSLLIVFSVALWLILKRDLHISCNCFGTSQTIVSNADILRNMIFILKTVVGVIFLLTSDQNQTFHYLDWALAFAVSCCFVLFTLNLKNVFILFQL